MRKVRPLLEKAAPLGQPLTWRGATQQISPDRRRYKGKKPQSFVKALSLSGRNRQEIEKTGQISGFGKEMDGRTNWLYVGGTKAGPAVRGCMHPLVERRTDTRPAIRLILSALTVKAFGVVFCNGMSPNPRLLEGGETNSGPSATSAESLCIPANIAAVPGSRRKQC